MNSQDHGKNEGRLIETVLGVAQNGIFALDGELRVVWANGWLETRFADRMPLVGKSCRVFWPEGGPSPDLPAWEGLEHGVPWRRLLPCPTSPGEDIWLEISLLRLEAESGRVRLAGQILDVTERKRAEDRLRDEVRRRRLLVEQSRDGIVVLDSEGRVYESNQRFADMLGYTLEEVVELCVWDWDEQWTREELLEMLAAVDDRGSSFETQQRRKDGSSLDVEISTNGATFGGRKLIFCVCRDITRRKRAEEERERLIGELQEALAEIKTLRGILPICSFCKKIRDEEGQWADVEVYIDEHSQAGISHGLCPECRQKHYPGYGKSP
jgi:PAS domain S-box-containing protein